MTTHGSTLADVLTALELRELPLLRWGLVDGVLTRSEVEEVLAEQVGVDSIESTLSDLLEHRLLLPTPTSGSSDGDGYRTRMAESIRLMRTLRQTMRYQASWQGRDLVADFQIVHRPRVRPRRDKPSADLLHLASDVLSPVGIAALHRITPDYVSAFQVRSSSAVLRAVSQPVDAGVMISAGTGAGKTIAFYGPALAHLADQISHDDSIGVRVLAIYPRGELLKDQFSNLARLTWAIGEIEGVRPIRIGCWFGPTPYAPHAVTGRQFGGGWDHHPLGRVHPFMKCPGRDCGADLVWPEHDIANECERLVCSQSCGVELDDRYVALTRKSLRQRPADVVLTTTESLNRQIANTSNRKAFGAGTDTLSLVLLDEVHTYEGTSGAQAALLMRRLRRLVPKDSNVTYVGLSATLENAAAFLADFVDLPHTRVELVQPSGSLSDSSEMEEVGAEYLIALRHNPAEPTGVLSATIQAAMLVPRILDARQESQYGSAPPTSSGLFGQRTFLFTDKLDVTNRLYWDLLDAEGWWSPNNPKTQYKPLALAHLRSEEQSSADPRVCESADLREPDGQWWWLAEQLGHPLGKETGQLTVSRTSSQDAGVTEGSDVVVATASLEVGYDDDLVGAVIQHKAPHDAARFIQRRGRAGRRMEMRPWTVVMLSNWGRDRLAWEAPEGLFDPDLSARVLPLRNRHVLKMQAVYATLDWLATKLTVSSDPSSEPVVPSTWNDLTAPAEVVEDDPARAKSRRTRQATAVPLLRSILLGGPERDDLRRYLRGSLGLTDGGEDDRELDAIFWSPPRSLLTVVIPTMLRRLETQWGGETPDRTSANVTYKNPLPEFVVGNLFGELLLPQVEIIPNAGSPEETEYLPTARTLREFLPGNITQHFGFKTMERRHWVPLPSLPSGTGTVTFETDVVQTYRALPIGRLRDEDSGNTIDVYQPTRVELQQPPKSVSNSSSVSPNWRVSIAAIGEPIDMSIDGSWAEVIEGLYGHLLARGGGVTVRRYATSASGQVGTKFPFTPVQINFNDGQPTAGRMVGLGYEFEANGISLSVRCPEDWEPSPRERVDWIRFAFESDADLPENLNVFDRRTIISGALVAAGRIEHRFADLPDSRVADEIRSALQDLGTLKNEVDSWLDDPTVIEGIRRSHSAGVGSPNEAWRTWRRRRFSATVAACLIQAAAREHPELDIDDLSIDVNLATDDSGSVQVWITEQTAGGNGQIDLVVKSLKEDPRQFRKRMAAELVPRGTETSGAQVTKVVELLADDDQASDLSEVVQDAWRHGHRAVSEAFAALRSYVGTVGLSVDRDAWSIVGSRLLGPGTGVDHLEFARLLDDSRQALEARTGLTLHLAETAAVLANLPVVIDQMVTPSATGGERVQAISRLLWSHSVESNFGEESFNRFGLLPPLDRQALRRVFADTVAEIRFDSGDLEQVATILEVLRVEGEVVVDFARAESHRVRDIMLALQQNPVEAPLILAYPVVTGVDHSDPEHLRITLTVPEIS